MTETPRFAPARARNHGCHGFAWHETRFSTFVIDGRNRESLGKLSVTQSVSLSHARNHERHVHAYACRSGRAPKADTAPFDLGSVVKAGRALLPLSQRSECQRPTVAFNPDAVSDLHVAERVLRGAAGSRLPSDSRRRDIRRDFEHAYSPVIEANGIIGTNSNKSMGVPA